MNNQNNNQASQMIRQLQASEQQNARQLQNMMGQVPEPAIRQQLQSLEQKEQQASQQLNQMSSMLNQPQNNTGMGMTQMSGFGNTNSVGLTSSSANFPQQSGNNSFSNSAGMNMSGTSGFGQTANQQSSFSSPGLGSTGSTMSNFGGHQSMTQSTGSTFGVGSGLGMNNSPSGLNSTQNASVTNQRNKNQNISFGVGHLMNKR